MLRLIYVIFKVGFQITVFRVASLRIHSLFVLKIWKNRDSQEG